MSIQNLKKNDIWEIKDCLGDTPAVCRFISRADSLITDLGGMRLFRQTLPYKIQPKRQQKLFESIEKAATNLDHKLSLLKNDQYSDLASLIVLLRETVDVKRFEKLQKELTWLSGFFERAATSDAQLIEFDEKEKLGIFKKGAGRPINQDLATVLDTLVTIYQQEIGKLPTYSKQASASRFHDAVVVIVKRTGVSKSGNLEGSLKAAIDRVQNGIAATIGC